MITRSRSRRRLRAVAILTTVTAVVPAGAAAAAPETPPQVRFVAAASAVTVERWEGDQANWMNLGTYLYAGQTPFEVRVTRASYRDPIVAQQMVDTGTGRRAVALPAGLVTKFSGFSDFTHVTLKDASGATVYDRDQDFCPNTYYSARTRPDAPDRSPYPQTCPSLPFTLGSVWGIQAGWSASTFSENPEFGAIDAPDGTYTATVRVNEPYRGLFGIPADQASATIAVTLRTVSAMQAKRTPQGTAQHLDAQLRAAQQQGAQHQGAQHHAAHGPALHGSRQGVGDSAPGLFPAKSRPNPTMSATMSAAAGPRPDLRSLPAWWINLSKEYNEDGSTDGRDYLSFDATVWNAGASPLVVDGFRRAGQDLMDAYQYFYDASGKQVGSAPAGTMEWDPRDGHEHWHFTAFAQYRLLDAGRQVAVRSGKEAFCLANTDAVDLTLPDAKWRPSNTELNTACGVDSSLAVRQVLDVGNGDTYAQYLPGQSFDITDVPNGTFYIEVAANPENRLQESNTANNVSQRKVILGGVPGARTLKVPPHEGIDG